MTMQDHEENGIINRLFQSFEDLEKAIVGARKTLEEKEGVPEEVVKRLSSYDTILEKQRTMATELCSSIKAGDWGEVTRQVGLINGLSAMIRDDARAILSSLSLNSDTEGTEEKLHYC
ncbi:hypothetical protein MRY87_01760 [bacterium]|nr:hypothetical protein [bacterium]